MSQQKEPQAPPFNQCGNGIQRQSLHVVAFLRAQPPEGLHVDKCSCHTLCDILVHRIMVFTGKCLPAEARIPGFDSWSTPPPILPASSGRVGEEKNWMSRKFSQNLAHLKLLPRNSAQSELSQKVQALHITTVNTGLL